MHWEQLRRQLQQDLLAGDYLLSPTRSYYIAKKYLSRWDAQDAVVLKALSLVLAPQVADFMGIPIYHLSGHGGVKGAVAQVKNALPHYTFALKSDVRQFYESMDHALVRTHCEQFIHDKRILSLITQYLNRCEVLNGQHRLIGRGIPKGCSLSPLVGAILLKSLDACIPKDAFYARYMDDWVILVKTRCQLRRMVKKMHDTMRALKFALATDKTFIGRISKGFDFLGYRFNHQGVCGIAHTAIDKFLNNIAMLYEQGASESRILLYAKRWRSAFSELTYAE